jgi:hypothetical protein
MHTPPVNHHINMAIIPVVHHRMTIIKALSTGLRQRKHHNVIRIHHSAGDTEGIVVTTSTGLIVDSLPQCHKATLLHKANVVVEVTSATYLGRRQLAAEAAEPRSIKVVV